MTLPELDELVGVFPEGQLIQVMEWTTSAFFLLIPPLFEILLER